MNLRVLGLVALLVGGCSLGSWFTKEPDQVSMPLQDARNIYARVDTVYKTLAAGVSKKCAANQLKASECEALRQVNEQAKQLDFEIRAKIDNPKAELDTAKVMKVLELIAGIAGKLT